MSISHCINNGHHHLSLFHRQNHHSTSPASFAPPSASLRNGADIVSHTLLHNFEETKDRIRSLFNSKVNLSVSSYDTAWVAAIPSPNNSHTPCFPQCLHWLLNNQLHDGSWGPLLRRNPLLVKDALSSTLASILALKRWGVGEQQINHGLEFLESNFTSATDNKQHSPVGFDIIFPGMLEYAKSLDLKLPLEPTVLNTMLLKRESELRRCYESHSHERESYLAYVSEGLGNLQDWEMVMKYQMKNGSILNSPSTTAAALAHLHSDGCLDYMVSLLDRFGDAVPTVHPLDLYVRLCMADNLERLGIDRHFRVEIETILDETYRCWQQEDEQIFMDVTTCAVAFRLLRMNGYDVSSDRLSEVANRENCFSPLRGHCKDLSAALEVYKASQIVTSHDEFSLIDQNSRSRDFLKQKLSDTSFPCDAFTKDIIQKVDHALMFSFDAVSERVASRRHIEDYSVHSPRILKTSYWSSNINSRDFLELAVNDYNACQSIYRGELKYLERWMVENKLNELKFVRQKAAYSYLTATATLFPTELSDARLSWAKNVLLATAVDDLFDVAGSMEELVNVIQLVEKWDVDIDKDCCSEHVRIIFLAIKRGIYEIEKDALKWQERSVKSHIIETWLVYLNSMLKEAVWAKDGTVPKMDEYIANGYVSFALGPIALIALYLVGPKLSEEIFRSGELKNLFKLVSTFSRLLNDTATFKREFEQGKLNAVTLQIVHSNGKVDEKEAIRETKISIERQRRELLRLVLNEKGSIVPRACKDLFWNIIRVMNLFYANGDGFSSDDMDNTVKSIIHEPISIAVDRTESLFSK